MGATMKQTIREIITASRAYQSGKHFDAGDIMAELLNPPDRRAITTELGNMAMRGHLTRTTEGFRQPVVNRWLTVPWRRSVTWKMVGWR